MWSTILSKPSKNKKNKALLDDAFNLQGEVFREQPGRETLRFVQNGEAYFIKRHTSPSLGEILKNLIQLRLPIWGARNEVEAIAKLAKFKFVPEIISYGFHGKRSFIITKALNDTISLADFQLPDIKLKWTLIRKIAAMAKTIHDQGINHRDFYLCHFLLALTDIKALKLYVIDWHRAQIRQKIPLRWRIKDIAGLYFSAMNKNLTRRDYIRFMQIYHNPRDDRFWKRVEKRAIRLYHKENPHVCR